MIIIVVVGSETIAKLSSVIVRAGRLGLSLKMILRQFDSLTFYM